MRGKMLKPQARILPILAMIAFLLAGVNVGGFTTQHTIITLIATIVNIGAGIFLLTIWWLLNHPRIPKWAEPYLKDDKEAPIIREIGSNDKDGTN